jgi:hypothetical protein
MCSAMGDPFFSSADQCSSGLFNCQFTGTKLAYHVFGERRFRTERVKPGLCIGSATRQLNLGAR